MRHSWLTKFGVLCLNQLVFTQERKETHTTYQYWKSRLSNHVSMQSFFSERRPAISLWSAPLRYLIAAYCERELIALFRGCTLVCLLFQTCTISPSFTPYHNHMYVHGTREYCFTRNAKKLSSWEAWWCDVWEGSRAILVHFFRDVDNRRF